MKLKAQELIAAIVLFATGIISLPRALHYFKYIIDFKFTFVTDAFNSVAGFIHNGVTILLILTPLIAVIAGVLLLLGKRKFALYAAAAFVLLRVFTFISTFLWFKFYTDFEVPFGTLFLDVIFGKVDIWVDFDDRFFPRIFFHVLTFILGAIAILLLFISKGSASNSEVSQISEFEAPHLAQAVQAPVAPVSNGMKACPECAEMIQVNAIKCRFCNYRYN